MKLKHIAFIVSVIIFGLILLLLLRSTAWKEGLDNQTGLATPDNSTATMGLAEGAKIAAKLNTLVPVPGAATGTLPPTKVVVDPQTQIPPGAGLPSSRAMGPPVFVQQPTPATRNALGEHPKPTGTPMPFSMAADPGILHRPTAEPTAAPIAISASNLAILQTIYFIIHGKYYGNYIPGPTQGTPPPSTSIILKINKKALDQYPELSMIDKNIILLLSQAGTSKSISAKDYALKVGSINSNAKSLAYKSASTTQLKDQFQQIQDLTSKLSR